MNEFDWVSVEALFENIAKEMTETDAEVSYAEPAVDGAYNDMPVLWGRKDELKLRDSKYVINNKHDLSYGKYNIFRLNRRCTNTSNPLRPQRIGSGVWLFP